MRKITHSCRAFERFFSPSHFFPRFWQTLNSAYASLAMYLGAKLAPVGLAWERAHQDAPNVGLIDGTQHPSPAGTYLAAAALFHAGLSKETVLSLQRVAAAVPLTPAP